MSYPLSKASKKNSYWAYTLLFAFLIVVSLASYIYFFSHHVVFHEDISEIYLTKVTNIHPDKTLDLSSNLSLISSSSKDQLTKKVNLVLKNHPLNQLNETQLKTFRMEDYFEFIKSSPQCNNLPVITTMGNVFSEMYWQLIENFIYTMVKFELSDCSIMICVSDQGCIDRCKASNFPCIHYQYLQYHPNSEIPSPLEQIAELKLFHIPKALSHHVDVFIVDLDVGFLENPLKLINKIDPNIDVYVQKDVVFVMNRTLIGWKTWYTESLPNIGVFYVRGNSKSTKMFKLAWRDYEKSPKKIRNNPGKDQNKVAVALLQAQYSFGLKWQYFPAGNAVLLDKIYKFYDPRYELGGQAALSVFDPLRYGPSDYRASHKMGPKTKDVGNIIDEVLAVHTTCYEQKSKIMGLKTSNAFWNPYYYDPTRKTLVKPLIFISESQVLSELRSLLYLALATNRSLIIPNLLGKPQAFYQESYSGMVLWPWFRLLYLKKTFINQNIQILEPGFYWRLERDYYSNQTEAIPSPTIIPFASDINIREMEDILLSPLYKDKPRLVLGIQSNGIEALKNPTPVNTTHLSIWSQDSVGKYRSYLEEYRDYGILPKIKKEINEIKYRDLAERILQETRLCDNFFQFNRGNRSCFDKCR